jgi:hypothetical protein
MPSWLDPPAVRERKRWLRAQPRTRGETDLEIGCLWPLAALLAVAIVIGVVIGLQVRSTVNGADHAVVRVIDDGAKPGPKVLTTAVVPLR